MESFPTKVFKNWFIFMWTNMNWIEACQKLLCWNVYRIFLNINMWIKKRQWSLKMLLNVNKNCYTWTTKNPREIDHRPISTKMKVYAPFQRSCWLWFDIFKNLWQSNGASVIHYMVFRVRRVTFFQVNRVEHQKLNQTATEWWPFGWVSGVQLDLRQWEDTN